MGCDDTYLAASQHGHLIIDSSATTSDRHTRIETDSLGAVEVPTDHLWGAQTQRCYQNFAIGGDRFRWNREVIRAFGILKKCAALTNRELNQLPPDKAELIVKAAGEVVQGNWDDEFPLLVFQTGSGTQSNMNANEVIANRAIQLAGGVLGSKTPIHPNDDVNRGQSSNDAFPTVMHIATLEQIQTLLIPAVDGLRKTLHSQSQRHADLVMVGRTHLQDAVPITLGQVFSGWEAQLDQAIAFIQTTSHGLYELAIGGTAVGTGLNTHPRFGEICARNIAAATGYPFITATNKFAALSAHDAIVNVSASLRTLAAVCMKLANDIRWYASGPRTGIGELILPENEPGSSIMPGKINPAQCEALTMVAAQVFGNDHTVAFAGSQGNFQLNVFKPVMLHNVLESIQLLADGCAAFNRFCVQDLEPNMPRIAEHLDESLMLVTALSPHIGYEPAAQIALTAHHEGTTLREAALKTGLLTPEQFEQWVRPEQMTGPTSTQRMTES